MTIKERVQEEIKNAMRAQDKIRLGTLRMILSEFKRIEIDERIVLDEVRALAILDKMEKQRRESMEAFTLAGRMELVEKEQNEIVIIQSFKPAALDPSEIQKLVSEAVQESSAASMQDMGKVMAILKPKLQGRADMSEVSALVKALLAAS